VHVGDLDGSTTTNGPNWKAVVTVAVHVGGTHAAVSGATVTGTFTSGGAGSCVTTGSGSCVITSASIKGSVASSTFTVTGVAGSGLTYTLPNHDVDGSSNGTTITVPR
jgi:hypothetical protein